MRKLKSIMCMILVVALGFTFGAREAKAFDVTSYNSYIELGQSDTARSVGLQSDAEQNIYLVKVPYTMDVTFKVSADDNDSHFLKMALYDEDKALQFLNVDYSYDNVNASYYNQYNVGSWVDEPITETRVFTYTCELEAGNYYFYVSKSDILKSDSTFLSTFSLSYPKSKIKYDLNVTGALTIAKGKTASLANLVNTFYKNAQYTWVSTNTSVATISTKGTITAKATGTTKIKLVIGSSTVWYITVTVE